jgi:hypothetical protein
MVRAALKMRMRLRAVTEVLVGAMIGMIPALIPASAAVALLQISKDSDSFMIAMLYAGSVGGCAVGIAFGKRRSAKSDVALD